MRSSVRHSAQRVCCNYPVFDLLRVVATVIVIECTLLARIRQAERKKDVLLS